MVIFLIALDVVGVITASGAVVTTALGLYLVHRRSMADRDTLAWRNGHNEAQQRLERELRREIAALKEAALVESVNTKPNQT